MVLKIIVFLVAFVHHSRKLVPYVFVAIEV